jgi:hypothetical protein
MVRINGLFLGTITISPWKDREKHGKLWPGPPRDKPDVPFNFCTHMQCNWPSSPFRRIVLYIYEKNGVANLNFWRFFFFFHLSSNSYRIRVLIIYIILFPVKITNINLQSLASTVKLLDQA